MLRRLNVDNVHKDDDGLHKAPSMSLESVDGVDTAKLSDAEKQMLSDLNMSNTASEDKDVFPPSIVEAVVPEERSSESVVLTQEMPEVVLDEPIPELEIEQEDPSLPENAAPPPLENVAPPPPLIDAEEEEEPVVAPEKNVTGSTPSIQTCPHCNWDMSLPAIAEPTYDEKMGFLHSVLGQKTFVHQYAIFGGKVVVRFRTLTTKEMDIIYRQVFAERETGEITTIQDYWEKVNRYKLYLQLTYLAAVDGSFTHALPEGYSPETNPHAAECYQLKPANPDHSYLPEIEEHVLGDVLRTETIQRSVNTICARFNRLVAKLEAMIDNSDFWNATEEQS
jgi:hypothetical protein